jgi:agmatinase
MDFLPPEEGFLGLPSADAASPGEADAVIVPFGLEASVSYGGGTARGPAAILEASAQVELFDEELWCEPHRRFGVATVKPFPIVPGLESAIDQIEGVVEQLVAARKVPLILGGEHSLTAGAIRPLVRRHPDLAILHFDAHADLRDGYEGEPYSHAAALRRCLDHPDVTLISVGIRNISAEEIPFLDANRHRIRIYWARDRKRLDPQEIASHVAGRPFYLTFDLDALDASLMPATGTPEPGGLFWDEVLDIIRAAIAAGTMVGADITELAPSPGLHACDFLAARLAYKILSYRFADKRPAK